MQIFIKVVKEKIVVSKVTFDVSPAITVVALKQLYINQIDNSVTLEQMSLFDRLSKPMAKDDLMLQDYNVQKDDTLELQISAGDQYDPQVEPVLKQDIIALTQEKSPQFVFIGIGSYDNGHPEKEISIKRQQCPDALLNLCIQKGWKLRILQVDTGFLATPSKSPQIYDIDKNWQLTDEIDKGKVRRYTYKGHDFQLCTYATKVFSLEYGGVAKTLAGVDLLNLIVPSVVKSGGCIVVGNFYLEGNKAHIAMGDKEVLKTLGYL